MNFLRRTAVATLAPPLFAALSMAAAFGANIQVPNEFSSIQAAINAAQPGDIIHLAAGRYAEILTIDKDLTIAGSGAANCVVYALTNIPVVQISGPAVVTLSNFEIEGGQYMGPGWFSGFSDRGITSINASLILQGMEFNQFKNYFVTISSGSLAATNVGLWTRNVLGGCDVGFELDGCSAIVDNLTQDAGHLDHTINVNGLSTNHADVTVVNCRIRTSSLDYGNCIRTYVNSRVAVRNSLLYRGAGEAVPAFPAFNHSGVSINGYSNTVSITGNIISNVPWGIYCYGSIGGNQVMVESNQIVNSPIGGVVWSAMSYRGIDLGGGGFGSRGGNIFTELPAPGTNFCADVLFTNAGGNCGANIFALRNSWSNPTNKETVIFDKLDNPAFGRLLADDLTITAAGRATNGNEILSWNERRAGELYTVESCNDVATGLWTVAPGAWPITNGGPTPMLWTNPAAANGRIFFRVKSVVP